MNVHVLNEFTVVLRELLKWDL